MGLCFEAAGKLTVVERRVGKTSNLWQSSEQVIGPLQLGAFSASGRITPQFTVCLRFSSGHK
jgi:hypothetical protein